MTKRDFILTAIAVLATVPAFSQNYGHGGMDEALTCADVHSDWGTRAMARGEQTITFTSAEAPKLTFVDAHNSGIHVTGWDKNEYSVLACKAASGDSEAEAKKVLEQIQVSRSGGTLSVTGPSSADERHWNVMLLVKAPRSASVDLGVHNGPVSVRNMAGGGSLKAQNGPVSLRDSSGAFTVETRNGPISYSGKGGDVKLNAQNGPITVDVAGEQWTGQLSGHAQNGPIELLLPTKFNFGVQVENENAPMSCNADACNAGVRMNGHQLTIGSSEAVIRLSTQHGPVTVENRKNFD